MRDHQLIIGEPGFAIPPDVLEQAGLREGDVAVAEPTADGVLIRRATVNDRIDADIAAGRATEFASDDEFRQALVGRMKQPE